MEYCLSYPWTFKRPPEELILNLERYLFRSKSRFQKADSATGFISTFGFGTSFSLPRAYQEQKSKDGDHLHIMTTQSLLVEILKNLKEAFWPFQCIHARSLFLSAANCINGRTTVEERAARSRLDRGHWTSLPYGDMRHALSACERLILLNVDFTELRDYSILLHHCGLYKESRKYLRRIIVDKSILTIL
ncbi:uncharacterized protein LOC122087917 isoform X2 [Macadamia integrifolia]|uniref:uncharacterized protein LOC122087917 isoform X2 n=1 Tax=Macadamia integrifolia TaxID=60698 RepID=UPI001C4FA3BC|nr:uncharacterized protein LOC122087917 isoform X2 [Macadamia integrifolia]